MEITRHDRNDQAPLRHRQFSLWTLLAATVLVGTGIGASLGSINGFASGKLSDDQRMFAFLQLLAGGPLLGAGLLLPWNRAKLGASCGFFIEILSGLAFAMALAGWQEFWQDLFWPASVTLFAVVLGVIPVVQWLVSKRRSAMRP